MKLYTIKQLKKKYAGKFINIYPHHHEQWDDKKHQFITVYEVRGTSSTIKENFEEVDNLTRI